jgi:hypothetical protein
MILKIARPIRPNPLIAILAIVSFFPFESHHSFELYHPLSNIVSFLSRMTIYIYLYKFKHNRAQLGKSPILHGANLLCVCLKVRGLPAIRVPQGQSERALKK